MKTMHKDIAGQLIFVGDKIINSDVKLKNLIANPEKYVYKIVEFIEVPDPKNSGIHYLIVTDKVGQKKGNPIKLALSSVLLYNGVSVNLV